MKALFFIIFLSSSSHAFSKHNYYNEYCQFDTIQGEVNLHKSHYWLGHHIILISDLPGIDDYPEVYLPGSEASVDINPTNGKEAIVFSTLSDFNVETTPYDDGCWQGFTARFERTVKIKDLKPAVSGILSLKKNDELNLKCNYEHLVMMGDKCDEL